MFNLYIYYNDTYRPYGTLEEKNYYKVGLYTKYTNEMFTWVFLLKLWIKFSINYFEKK